MKLYKGLLTMGLVGAFYSTAELPVQAESSQEQQVLVEEADVIEQAFEDEALLQVVREITEANGHTALSSEALEEITKLTKVRELDISSLKGIELLTNLKELEMRTNNISDLSPLSTLASLKKLDLRENNLSTLDGLQSLIGLKELDVRVNNIQDLTPLSGLINLEVLDIRDNTVTDLAPISGLVRLTELSARNNSIVDLRPIENMIELTDLNLHSNQVNDLTPLTKLTKIKTLVVRRNQISDISPLAQLVLLEDLNIRDNQIQDISPLAGLENLKVRLNLDGNVGITDFSPIAHYYSEIEDVDFVLPNETGPNLDYLEPLSGQERSDALLRYTIESNQYIKDPSIRTQKLTNLAANPFAFYRGTAELFFQDVKDQVVQVPDSWAPLNQARTWITGDLHVENIGFYGNQNKEAIFELNDFDEAAVAPFYFDMLNFGTSLYLLNDSAPRLQLSPTDIQSIVEAYSGYYREAINQVQTGQINAQEHHYTSSNLEGFVGEYMQEVSQTAPNKQLATWTTVSNDRQFDLSNNRLAEATALEKADLIDHWDSYLEGIDSAIIEAVGGDYFAIKDIARRVDAGLGSLGYDRYYVLIEGETGSSSDDIILDIKAQGPSAVEASGLFESGRFTTHAERTITGVRALHNYPDIHWGTLETQDQSFLVKERTLFKDEIGAVDFSGSEDLDQFVKTSAEVTAYAHARAADTAGNAGFTAMTSAYFNEQGSTFDTEFTEVSLQYYAQVLKDHELYANLFAAGAFENVDEEIVEETVPEEGTEIDELAPVIEGADDSAADLGSIEEDLESDAVSLVVPEEKPQSTNIEEETGIDEVQESSAMIDNTQSLQGAQQYEQNRLPQTSYALPKYNFYGFLLLSSGALLLIFEKKKQKFKSN